ncbi:uncharacterized protein TNCV_4456121 [Trichonephila clavipes]|nr:uncharacterized protein TNCV_4456121 [Trichonephila clavipes]
MATDHVILNHGQVTWTTPELAPPLLTTTPHQQDDVSALDRFNVHRCPTRRVFSGTGLELVTRQATIRYIYHSATAATYSGPYTVLRKCSDVLFEIDRPNFLNKTDTELVHSVPLRHFHPSENFQLNYIQQNTHNNEKKIITKRNILRNTEITEFCLTRLFGEKE